MVLLEKVKNMNCSKRDQIGTKLRFMAERSTLLTGFSSDHLEWLREAQEFYKEEKQGGWCWDTNKSPKLVP